MAQKSREDRVEAWVARVQPSIAHCYNCQAWDGGEVFWVTGNRVQLGEHLDDLRVPADIRDDVAERLTCGQCRTGDFSLSDDIGTGTDEERAHAARWQSWEKRYSAKLDAFGTFLSQYPYLGASHALGHEIRRMIAHYNVTAIKAASWWRARRAQGAQRLTVKDMRPPDKSCPVSEGRFNHYGQPLFYLAEHVETALAETLNHEKNEVLAWVQEFRLPQIDGVLDLVGPDWDEEGSVPLLALGLLSHMDRLAPPRDSPWKPEYFVPRYIADCAREAGFKAILFRSTRARGTNLVLFEWEDAAISPVGEPQSRNFVPADSEF